MFSNEVTKEFKELSLNEKIDIITDAKNLNIYVTNIK
jgi:hypothetical protein